VLQVEDFVAVKLLGRGVRVDAVHQVDQVHEAGRLAVSHQALKLTLLTWTRFVSKPLQVVYLDSTRVQWVIIQGPTLWRWTQPQRQSHDACITASHRLTDSQSHCDSSLRLTRVVSPLTIVMSGPSQCQQCRSLLRLGLELFAW
jgi:hypothetical protein